METTTSTMNPMRAKQLVVGPPSKKRRRHRSEFVAVVIGLELGGSMVVLSSEVLSKQSPRIIAVLILLSGDVLKLPKQDFQICLYSVMIPLFWKANVKITQMAKEASGGGGGEAEQEEEERWRKREDKDTKGRRGCGEVDGRRQHMRLRRLDLDSSEDSVSSTIGNSVSSVIDGKAEKSLMKAEASLSADSNPHLPLE
ncbi:hypothetical protein HID58_056953 [Brassica napus]|uniref:Uncharacterized protein n=1 Tax=Brassica napus TaxID=3708 RepID=A0ABQ8APQ4_BRANA|nr:hypothetical protein HID58_056953 [Brassica napus]